MTNESHDEEIVELVDEQIEGVVGGAGVRIDDNGIL